MEVKQINLKLPENLHRAAESYAKNFGFRNIQEFISASIREKIFESDVFLNDNEILMVDESLKDLREGKTTSLNEFEKEMNKNVSN